MGLSLKSPRFLSNRWGPPHKIDTDISIKSIEVILCNLSQQGRIDRRRAVRILRMGVGRPSVYEYKAIDAFRFGRNGTARFPVPANATEPSHADAVKPVERSVA